MGGDPRTSAFNTKVRVGGHGHSAADWAPAEDLIVVNVDDWYVIGAQFNFNGCWSRDGCVLHPWFPFLLLVPLLGVCGVRSP